MLSMFPLPNQQAFLLYGHASFLKSVSTIGYLGTGENHEYEVYVLLRNSRDAMSPDGGKKTPFGEKPATSEKKQLSSSTFQVCYEQGMLFTVVQFY